MARHSKSAAALAWIDKIHRWTGAVIGLLLAVLGITGTFLLYEDAWLRATVPHAAEPFDADQTFATAERLLSSATARPNIYTGTAFGGRARRGVRVV